MKSQKPQGGRIINNGSISASVPRPDSAPYTCSKHAITGLTRSTSLDGRKYNICCGQIDIGNVETPMAKRMKTGALQADGQLRVEPTFDIKHVVDALLYMASLPLEANVQFMTVMATKMPFIGRGWFSVFSLQSSVLSTQSSVFSTQFPVLSLQYSVFSTATAHCQYCRLVNCRLPTGDWRLPTAHDCRLPTADCRLPTAGWPLASPTEKLYITG